VKIREKADFILTARVAKNGREKKRRFTKEE
jgi:hypothetical protein